MADSLQSELKALLLSSGVEDGALNTMWRAYLDTNTSTDLSGVTFNEAERAFLIEKLSLDATIGVSLNTLWELYFEQEGHGGSTYQEKFLNWIISGGVISAEVWRWDTTDFTFDSTVYTFDGSSP